MLRNGLVVDVELLAPSGTAEHEAATGMVARIENTDRVTVSTDKGYETQEPLTRNALLITYPAWCWECWEEC